jgi:hypothetical protein
VVPQQDRFQYKRCLSDYQNTVDDLPALEDLAQLPDNQQKQQFVELCQGYWAETVQLLEAANMMQGRRYSN